MKAKDFAALGKKLLPQLPGFIVKGPMTFMSPVGYALRGLYFEGSSFDAKSFYVWWFFLPLCVPQDVVSFNLGDRLRERGADRWNADASNLMDALSHAIQADAVPTFQRLSTPGEAATSVRKRLEQARDLHGQEAMAYLLGKAGDVSGALMALDELLAMLNTSVPWQLQMKVRAELLRALLSRDPRAAAAQLEAWERDTVRNLGLNDYL